jgi:hypothetical protein
MSLCKTHNAEFTGYCRECKRENIAKSVETALEDRPEKPKELGVTVGYDFKKDKWYCNVASIGSSARFFFDTENEAEAEMRLHTSGIKT